MKIHVSLHDTLKSKINPKTYGDKDVIYIIINPDSSVNDLLKALRLSPNLIGLVIVNGRQVGPDYQFSDQDRVDLFSPLAGG